MVVVALVGCTGDDGPSASTTTAPPPVDTTATTTIPTDPAQAAFVAQINPICVTRNEQIIAAVKIATVPDAAGALAKRARLSVEAVEQIRTVAPPAGDEATVEAMLAEMDEVNQHTADLATAVLYVDAESGRRAAAALHAQLPALNEQLVAYGLGDCVLDPPTG